MDSGSWAAVNGALRTEMRLDVLSNNLANSSTTGYKEGDITFDSYLTKPGPELFPLPGDSFMGLKGPGDVPFPFSNPATNALPVTYPAAPGTTTNMTQGGLKPTGNPLDMALEGEGFFVVNTPEGERYTRDGSFMINTAGELVNRSGYQVMGESGPIVLGIDPVSVGPDGTLSNPRGVLGRIKRVSIPDDVVKRTGGNLYSATAEKVAMLEGKGSVKQGCLETSNVNVVRGMTQMIEANRAFESYMKAIQTLDGLDGQAVQIGRLA